jgi:hypothetical protein
MAGGFVGVTSWQRVCRSLGVPWSALPDTVLDVDHRRAKEEYSPAQPVTEKEEHVTVRRDLDPFLEAHRARLAKRRRKKFPPLTDTDAAREALKAFYDSAAWRTLEQAARNGSFPKRRPVASSRRWTFVLQKDTTLLSAIDRHADILDGSRDDAADDALYRYYSNKG